MPLWTRRISEPFLGGGIDWTHPSAPGLVLALPFNAGSGTIAVDSTAINPPATLGSLATWGPGSAGNAVFLPGTQSANNAVTCGNTAPLKFGTGPFTAMCRWMSNNPPNTQYIMAYGSSGSLWYYRDDGGSILRAAVVGTTLANPTVSPAITAGSWHVACMTRDPANLCTMYHDGRSIGTNTIAGSVNGTNGLALGYDWYTGANDLNGAIDCALMWNRALSAAEVATLSANPWPLWGPAGSRWLMGRAAAGALVRRTVYDHPGSRGVA